MNNQPINLTDATFADIYEAAMRRGYVMRETYVDNQSVRLVCATTQSPWRTAANKRLMELQTQQAVRLPAMALGEWEL
jgi:hypothetical protein